MTLAGVTVRDSFGEVWDLTAPPASGPAAWSLFHTAGLPESQLLVWPVAIAPQPGPVLDEVLIGVDEDANLAWAVELRADGVQLLRDAEAAAAVAETTRTGTRDFRYLPSTTLPNGWHPYQRVRLDDPQPSGGMVTAATDPGAGDGRSGGWRQGVLADLTGLFPRPRPGPVSRLIGGPSGAASAAATNSRRTRSRATAFCSGDAPCSPVTRRAGRCCGSKAVRLRSRDLPSRTSASTCSRKMRRQTAARAHR